MTMCAIHQPNFFPWLGYFDKIKRADIFIFLDQVHYPKSGNSMGSWCNRVKVNVGGNASWTSCPVLRQSGIQFIDTVKIDERRPWRDSMRQVLETNYRETRNFQSVFALMDQLLNFNSDRLADFNINAIQIISKYLGYETQFVRQSELLMLKETSSERLIALTRAVGADAYLCGGGSSDYLDESAFSKAGVGLIYQNFRATPYGSSNTFIPGLSVIDWLMRQAGE
jgi:hypothetical protein